MLESRAAYGYYGCGHGVTGEDAPKYETKRMHYRKYKQNYSQYKAVDYDKSTKEITVLIPADEFKKFSNEGNRYQILEFHFLTDMKIYGISPYIMVKAKNRENALKHAKTWGRKEGFNILREATLTEVCSYSSK